MQSIARCLLVATAAWSVAGAHAGAGPGVPAEATVNRVLHRGAVPPPVSEATLVAALRLDAAKAWQGAGLTADPAGLRVGVQAVTWGDGSLGCPQPGQAYTMALVPGWQVKLEVAGLQRIYHASRSGHWLLCPPGSVVMPAPGGLQTS